MSKNSNAQRYPGQLRDDAESIERRKWYIEMEKKIFESIDQREQLYRMAQAETTVDVKDISSLASSVPVPMSYPIPKLQYLKPMNEVAESSCDSIAICFPGIAKGYNCFKAIAKILTEERVMMFGATTSGKMHLCTKPPFRSFRKIVYLLRDDVKSILSAQNKKVIFIGHCFGCLIAYEVARLLVFEKLLISGMIVMSSRTPLQQSKFNNGDDSMKLHNLSDRELMKAFSDLNFIPTIFSERKDLIRRNLPMIRTDLNLFENYHVLPPYLPNQSVRSEELNGNEKDSIPMDELEELLEMPPSLFKITIPIYSICGDEDSFVSDEECKKWRQVSSVFHDHTSLPECSHDLLHSTALSQVIVGTIRKLLNPEVFDSTDS